MRSAAALNRRLGEYRVAKNAGYLLFTNLATRALAIVYVALLARYVGPHGIGVISIATALNGVLVLMVGAGLNTLTVREVSAAPQEAANYATHMLLLKALLSVPFAIVVIAGAHLGGYEVQTVRVIYIYGIVYWFDTLGEIPFAIFQAFERMEFESLSQIVQVIVNIGLSLLAIALEWSLLALAAISALAQGAKLLLALSLMRRHFVRSRAAIVRQRLVRFFWSGLPFAAFTVLNVLRFQIGILILSLYYSTDDVGIYSAATSLLSILLIAPAAFSSAIYPVFSHAYAHARDRLRRFYQTCYTLLLMLGFPLGIGTILVGGHVIHVVYGDDFGAAAPVLSVLGVFLMTIVGYCNGPLLNAANRQSFFAWTEALAIGTNIALCLILVPREGPAGAALAVLIPGLGTFAAHSLVCHRILALPFPALIYTKVAAATGVMAIAVWVALRMDIGWFAVTVGIAPAVYGSMVLALKIVSRDELQLVARANLREERLNPV